MSQSNIVPTSQFTFVSLVKFARRHLIVGDHLIDLPHDVTDEVDGGLVQPAHVDVWILQRMVLQLIQVHGEAPFPGGVGRVDNAKPVANLKVWLG
jgi:hypothetical protein